MPPPTLKIEPKPKAPAVIVLARWPAPPSAGRYTSSSFRANVLFVFAVPPSMYLTRNVFKLGAVDSAPDAVCRTFARTPEVTP